jgi:hypothetical protein
VLIVDQSEVFEVPMARREEMEEMCFDLFAPGGWQFIGDVLWFADSGDAFEFKLAWTEPDELKYLPRVS